MADCPHENFYSVVEINRLLDSGAFIADIRIKCTDCDMEFDFPDPPFGLSSHEVRVSMDRRCLHVPIKPSDKASFPAFAGFDVRRVS